MKALICPGLSSFAKHWGVASCFCRSGGFSFRTKSQVMLFIFILLSTRADSISSNPDINLINLLCVLFVSARVCVCVCAGAGGWSPLVSDRYQWLEVDLGERTKITAVATQGRYGSSDWLSSYLLMFSDSGHNWRQYRQEDSIGFFPGNSNADSVVQYKLQQPAVARFLRLLPLDWNPSGRIGLRLETYGCPYTSDVVSLRRGGGGLVYRLSPGTRRTSKEVVSLKFKTQRNSGTLLQAEGHEGSSLHLELQRGKLLLLWIYLLGPAVAHLSLMILLDDQHWHHVVLERRSTHLNLTVDKHTERVQLPLFVGEAHRSHFQNSFHGCIENLLYNGQNLIELAKHNDHRVTGNVTFSCGESVSVAVTFPGPQSFLQMPWATPTTFRTWNKAGLLATFSLQQGGVAWLHLSDSRLQLLIHQGDKEIFPGVFAGSDLSDGQWHSVDLTSKRGHITISVDEEEGGVAHATPSFPISTGEGQVFFGGKNGPECRNLFDGFQGCMRLLTLDDRPVDLIAVQQRLLGNYSQLQIDMCGIMDRCSPSRCEHGGRCSQSWTVFHCNCSDSGYDGATCHSSVYEQSCEAYKHNGNTSGHFYIDVDGSGPIGPQLVYCNMTGDTHTHTHTHTYTHTPTPHHLSAYCMIDIQSEHCEQELSYHCRKSRLLNTLEGSPFSWWLGGPGPGRVQTYWGGAQPGSQQCACGLQGDCVDPEHYCNCDADRMEWTEDSGLLTHKPSLPVRSLVLGDVQRPGSEAAYRVGPLLCRGDRNFWNAAFFDKETSYLHFPTFHGELSADISFLFKTTASFGVFLENLGIKDFIRIELSSSTQVIFSFDVGNGPLEVRVESSVPLNDNRWHRVRAERNVKEATLRLDDLPVATQEAPADGHFHLQLNSQLFIGGTASRQKGFRGCIRSLQLNGVTLDLEERAKITPGVRPGCPGHCSSYGSLCQNQGRCTERENGFHCDCSLSAFSGVFCQTEVSASFKSGTSVRYTFKEVYEVSRNSSALPSSIYSDATLRGENVSLSFRTSQSPALLLYVSSYYREYLALLINKHGDGKGVYKMLPGLKPAVATFTEILSSSSDSDDMDPDLARLGSQGFAGCLSVVHFNTISPLKAALLHPDSSPVSISGPLVQSSCGSAASANPYAAENTHHLSVSGACPAGVWCFGPWRNGNTTPNVVFPAGVIAVVIFVMVTGMAVAARFLYRRKETYRNQEVKGVKREDSQDFPFNSRADSQNVSGENPKEFFM
uniref:Contactin associated protein like 3 n=1 Tax=Salarias fasciatus TaxID=181472 RepID=A0A672JR34_SALFA